MSVNWKALCSGYLYHLQIMMCIAVSAVCICIFMFFYDSSAYWTKRPFRAVRSWQALPFTLTILLACIVRWAHHSADIWFPLKPMYDFNLIQQSSPKGTLLRFLSPFIFHFHLPFMYFCSFYPLVPLPTFKIHCSVKSSKGKKETGTQGRSYLPVVQPNKKHPSWGLIQTLQYFCY